MPPDVSRSCERQFSHPGIVKHGRNCVGRPAGRNDIDDSRRHARLFENAGHRQCRKRRFFRRLQDDRATSRQGRTDFARGHRRGEIPRRHQHGDTDRLTNDQDTVAASGRNSDIALDAHGFLRIPSQELCRVVDLRERLRQRLSAFQGDQTRKLLPFGRHGLERAPQQFASRAGRGRRPTRRSRMSCRNRRHSVGHGSIRDGCDDTLVAGIHHLDPRAVAAFAPTPVDKQFRRRVRTFEVHWHFHG
jgi:hypothetical protein